MISHEGDGGERLAPVTYLPGAEPADKQPVRWTIPLEPTAGEDVGAELSVDDEDDEQVGSSAEDADALLTRRLRRSALSEREARTFLAQRGVAPAIVEATVERFISRGWIDDAVLAEQLLYAGTSRKGQGRRAIAQTLSTRGIARDVADAALAALPDDDDERALEYARSKANGLRSYDMDTAMRRLMGQLARRGYSGSAASTAARTALTEQRGGGGVQFR
ncbi:regulatory protein RecX [Microbacterium terregens]|jgi:regulatory protein|uniref:Regulatory protein RecX n=1 Tax=Microbacterium terregens TaxID=69363 RepID=A0ABV5T0A7_9MICO